MVAAILLAVAAAGAAAFAHGLAGGSHTEQFGIDALPPAPTSPLVVEAVAGPPPALRLHAATAQHARVVVSVVAHARPIVIAAIPHPAAHTVTPLPVPPLPVPPLPVPVAPQPVTPPPPPVATPATTPATTPVRAVASVAPVVTAVPVKHSGRGHDHGHHGDDQKRRGNSGGSDDSGPPVLAAVPLDPAAVPPVETPPAVTIDPPAADDLSSAEVVDGDPSNGHGHGHGHQRDHGQ